MTESFEDYLKQRGLNLKSIHSDEGEIYRGKMMLTSGRCISFSFLISEGVPPWINYQIFFEPIITCSHYYLKESVLELLNDFNREGQGYYTLLLNRDGQIALRTIACAKDYEMIFQVFLSGLRTIEHLDIYLNNENDEGDV